MGNMPATFILLFFTLVAQPAEAHGLLPVGPEAFWQSWSFDPWVIVPLLVVHWLYGRGVLRLWAKAGTWRGIGWPQIAAFIGGEFVLMIALVSPLDRLGGTLVSAHMVQHGLLVAAAPPLLLLSHPGAAFAWGLLEATKRGALRVSWRFLSQFGRSLSRPMPAAILHGAALWAWHAPPLFEAALRNEWIHSLEHAMFFGTALLFWQAIVSARPGFAIGPAMAVVLITTIHTGLLGALLTFAPSPLYPWYAGRANLWGLSAQTDQQLAGLIMWVPMGLVYVVTGVILAGRLLLGEAKPKRPVRPTLS
jgi:putative membrane protein